MGVQKLQWRRSRKIIGADTLHYLSIEDLLKTVEGAGCNFCTGCFDGNYPMDIEKTCEESEKLDLEKGLKSEGGARMASNV